MGDIFRASVEVPLSKKLSTRVKDKEEGNTEPVTGRNVLKRSKAESEKRKDRLNR